LSQYPLIIGHRGASAAAPENTLAAFRKAIEAGADGIEFDVRLSRDGVPVIIHDETLRRTASRSERVGDLTAEEMQNANVGSWFSIARGLSTDDYRDEEIPTLRQLLEMFSTNNALLYLELKCANSEIPQIVAATNDLLESYSIGERTIVECFDLTAIEEMKRHSPAIRTAALFEPSLANPSALLSGKTLVARALAAGANEIALHHRLANKRTIEAARAAGLKIVVWTVDDPRWLTRSRELGVDCLITNDPSLMVRRRNQVTAV
jgi:glycerophosphoryl diester phosphodiesterase